MKYCEILMEEDLPPLRKELAKASKKQALAIIQDDSTKFSISLQHYIRLLLVVSPQLAQDLINFTFIAQMANDIKVGLNPFAIISGSKEHCANNIEIACTYGLLIVTDWLVFHMLT